MEFFKIKHDIPFMSYGRITTAISLVTFLVAVFFLATRGLNFGVDFTGGTVMEVHYAQPADLNKVREQLTEMGLKEVLVQNFGSSHDVLVQVPLKENLAGNLYPASTNFFTNNRRSYDLAFTLFKQNNRHPLAHIFARGFLEFSRTYTIQINVHCCFIGDVIKAGLRTVDTFAGKQYRFFDQ